MFHANDFSLITVQIILPEKSIMHTQTFCNDNAATKPPCNIPPLINKIRNDIKSDYDIHIL